MDKNEIRSLFEQHDVPLGKKDVWAVQGTPVVKHQALERLSAALKIKWEKPEAIIHTMQDVVILAIGSRQDGITEWSYGECSIVREGVVGGNYKVSGKQAAYPWAMAEKRAKDRVIIKLAGLHGAYSSDEADDFNDNSKKDFDEEPDRQTRQTRQTERPQADNDAGPNDDDRTDQRGGELSRDDDRQQDDRRQEPEKSAARRGRPAKDKTQETQSEGTVEKPQAANDDGDSDVMKRLKAKLDECETPDNVADFMLAKNVQSALSDMGTEDRENVRDYAKKRMAATGWPGGQKQAS